MNRKVQYKGADVFMICVAANQRSSFDNIEKWAKEICKVKPRKPIMLVLTKSDTIDLIDEYHLFTFENLKTMSKIGEFSGAY